MARRARRKALTVPSWTTSCGSVFQSRTVHNLRRWPAKLKESAYISLFRSTLEYAASVWDPHLAKDINKLENIQRSARFVKDDYRTTSSVTQMLQELGWQDLQSHRRDLRLALLYKVIMGPAWTCWSSSRSTVTSWLHNTLRSSRHVRWCRRFAN